jgi:3-oxoacyl-(acyl-carrier-protein) synthase
MSPAERADVVITGIGLVSPYGTGAEVFWEGVRAGRSALRPLTRFDAAPYRNHLGGEVPDVEPGPGGRAARYAALAAVEAVRAAGLDASSAGSLGLVLGTNFGGMSAAESFFAARARGEAPRESLRRFLPGDLLRAVRETVPAAGPEAVLSLSCASGAAALGTALEWIRLGRAEAVLAGGTDELSETAVAGLSALRAITKETIRPFDAERSGTIFSEGAGVFVVESAAHAARRGAAPVARLLGRGMNNDAFHMTAPDKTGSGIAAVMRMALADAGLAPEAVAHLNCHGTGTKYNDAIETLAVKTVFGAHASRLVLTANKSLFGHAMGAAGALEAAATCFTIRDGLVPPTVNVRARDPELDLDVVLGEARAADIPVAMTNSYGIGGTNASLVLARP